MGAENASDFHMGVMPLFSSEFAVGAQSYQDYCPSQLLVTRNPPISFEKQSLWAIILQIMQARGRHLTDCSRTEEGDDNGIMWTGVNISLM